MGLVSGDCEREMEEEMNIDRRDFKQAGWGWSRVEKVQEYRHGVISTMYCIYNAF